MSPDRCHRCRGWVTHSVTYRNCNGARIAEHLCGDCADALKRRSPHVTVWVLKGARK